MIRKTLSCFIAAALALSLAACSSTDSQEEPLEDEALEPASYAESVEDAMNSDDVILDEDADEDENADFSSADENDAEEEIAEDVSAPAQETTITETAADSAEVQAAAGNSTLIVYFSRHGSSIGDTDIDAVSSASLSPGNVILVANMVEQLTSADTFQIVTVDPYPKDYRETTNVAADEKNNNARPALSTHVENMDAYDTIILGYPNWWGTIPMPVASFLEEYDLSGKTILPYCVHEGSGLGSSVGDITALAPGSTVLSGLAISTSRVSASSDAVSEWLAGHGIV